MSDVKYVSVWCASQSYFIFTGFLPNFPRVFFEFSCCTNAFHAQLYTLPIRKKSYNKEVWKIHEMQSKWVTLIENLGFKDLWIFFVFDYVKKVSWFKICKRSFYFSIQNEMHFILIQILRIVFLRDWLIHKFVYNINQLRCFWCWLHESFSAKIWKFY